MTTNRKTGVWMDHSNAFIVKLTDSSHLPQIIASGFDMPLKRRMPPQSEKTRLSILHRKKRTYHKSIAAALIESDEVFLFGPTDAKRELFKMLRNDENFDAIPIAFDHSFHVKDLQENNCFSGQGIQQP
jgi:hypothetical protein